MGDGLKPNDLKTMLANASRSTQRLNPSVVAGVSAAIVEPGALSPLASRPQNEAGGTGRVCVTITVATTRLRDPDNTVVKWLVDAMRYAGIIRDDAETDILLNVRQVKVKTKAQQGTLIEVTPLP